MGTSVTQRIDKLRDELNHHNHLYHVLAKPQISDQEYDKLMHELIDLETAHPDLITPDSPTQRIGGEPIDGFETVTHAVRMMSIDNTYDADELRAFDTRVRKGLDGVQPKYVLEPKVDGVAVSLRYESGRLTLAATRGDGARGDDITANAKTIRPIPLLLKDHKHLPRILEVRGEVFMTNEQFQKINKKREEAGEELFANPRNFTAGTLKQLDPKITASRNLKFVSHGLGEVDPPFKLDSYFEILDLLKTFGLPTNEQTNLVDNIDQAVEDIEAFAHIRGTLKYQTDGMVVKVDSLAQREILGVTSKAPRWIIAYKYPAEQVQTVLNGVRWQVGKNGTLTPVADMEPVFVAGTTVKRASLHNIEQIQNLDIHIGDTIIIEKAGEIIPQVVLVVKPKRPKDAKPIKPPTKCPSCGAPVEKEIDGPFIRCINPSCPAQLKERLRYFCGRKQMDIEGLGESILNQLVDQKLVKTFGDIFRLRVEQIASLTHEVEVGVKAATKIIDAIKLAKSRKIPISAPLGMITSNSPDDLMKHILWLADAKQMDIKGLGDKTIAQLVDNELVKSATDLFHITIPQLAALSRDVRVGEKSAKKIIDSINTAKGRGLARVLAGIGIRHVGTTVARDIAIWGGNIETLLKASVQDLRQAISGSPLPEDESIKVRELAKRLHKALHKTPKKASIQQADTLFGSQSVTTKDYLESNIKKFGLAARVREKRIQLISDSFPTVPQLLDASEDQLFEVISERKVIANSVYDFLHSTEGQRIIRELKEYHVKLEESRPKINKKSPLAGKTVVITGTFPGYSREELTEKMIALGATVTGSVSNKTDIVFAGDQPGSKYSKAQELGITIWSASRVLEEMGNTK
jgi:DNA ligase (NAD+)